MWIVGDEGRWAAEIVCVECQALPAGHDLLEKGYQYAIIGFDKCNVPRLLKACENKKVANAAMEALVKNLNAVPASDMVTYNGE